jgi:hypothetical protein
MSFFDFAVNQMLAGEPIPELFWFLVPFLERATGKFVLAVIVQAEHPIKAIDPACAIHRPGDKEKLGTIIKIVDERLPAESYRNRPLNREEIEAMWPQQKEERTKQK